MKFLYSLQNTSIAREQRSRAQVFRKINSLKIKHRCLTESNSAPRQGKLVKVRTDVL